MVKRKKDEEVKEVKPVKPVEPVKPEEVVFENPLFVRQRELLALIQAMKNEGAEDVGKLEVKLSIVNRDIANL